MDWSASVNQNSHASRATTSLLSWVRTNMYSTMGWMWGRRSVAPTSTSWTSAWQTFLRTSGLSSPDAENNPYSNNILTYIHVQCYTVTQNTLGQKETESNTLAVDKPFDHTHTHTHTHTFRGSRHLNKPTKITLPPHVDSPQWMEQCS